jgi:phosphoribosylcarboxyaminoimidazole (NCAIR) mutase
MAMPSGPRVGVIMGSDSDWPVMEAAAAACSITHRGPRIAASK